MPPFSVIIPTFNRERLIAATLESVFAQTETDFEVIVVDDGSTDGTVAALAPWRDRITLLTQSNQGPGPARNLGARHARSDYLCFLDSDDLWFPWTLAFARALVERDRPSLIASMPVPFSDPAQLRSVAGPGGTEVVERYLDYLASDPVNIFPGAGSMVVRADAFAASGGFSTTRMGAEDAELFLRLGTQPGFVFVRRPALVAYRTHSGSFSTDVGAGLAGRWEMIRLEREGRFPGGGARRRERIEVIASHCRSGTIVALRAGQVREAIRLYGATRWWHVQLGRWKYLLGFPLLALRAALRGPTADAAQGFLPAAPGLPQHPAPSTQHKGEQVVGAGGSRPCAAVIFATRNRKDELRRALNSCLAQTVPVEIIVRDDASTDGTGEMITAEFPMANYARSDQPRGSIPNRNEAVAAASAPIIFSLDDDAAFDSPRTVEQTLADFEDERVGIVAIPFIDVLKGNVIEQAAPRPDGIHVLDTFRGCAAAWRRVAFLAVGGYSPILRHMAEEPDLALRLLDRGYVVRAGRADPVHHYESVNRDWDKIWRQIARNGVLQGWMTAPWFMLPIHLVGTLLSSLRTGLRVGKPRVLVGGALRGLLDCFSPGARRRPVSPRAYFLCRWLRQQKPAELEQIKSRLPDLIAPTAT